MKFQSSFIKREGAFLSMLQKLLLNTYFEQHLQTAASVQMQQWFQTTNAYEAKKDIAKIDCQNVFKALL